MAWPQKNKNNFQFQQQNVMLKKILKWTGIIISSLLAIVLVFYAVAYFNTESRINKVYDVKLQKLVIPTDSASYNEGKHIAENRGCLGCHGQNLSGGIVFFDETSPLGILATANLTTGKGGINYSDEDWVRALRHGLAKDNKSVWFMPSNEVCNISNHDMAALICFLKQQPPVDKIVPAKSIKPLTRILVFLDKFNLFPAEIIDHNAVYKDTVAATVTAAYGGYLTTSCQGCHGAQMKGNPPHGDNEPPIPNISSTGVVGKWTETDFLTALHTGKTPEGKQLSDYMPWKALTYTDDELKAIYLYLHGLK